MPARKKVKTSKQRPVFYTLVRYDQPGHLHAESNAGHPFVPIYLNLAGAKWGMRTLKIVCPMLRVKIGKFYILDEGEYATFAKATKGKR